MNAVLFFAISFFLFAGFLVLLGYEQAHGKRFCASARARLDRRVDAFSDWISGAHVEEEVARMLKGFGHRVLHDITATALFGVRVVERELTKLVRSIRRKKEVLRGEGSAYVRTIAGYKQDLRGEEEQKEDTRTQ